MSTPPAPVELHRTGPDDWRLWRGIRLRALEESPDAFGSTLAREQAFGEAEWRQRSRTGVVAVVDGEPVALGAAYDDGSELLNVVAMWVDPAHRGRGLSTLVLAEILAMARAQGRGLQLEVVRDNGVARRAYLARGFVPTGELRALRPGSQHVVEVMVLK